MKINPIEQIIKEIMEHPDNIEKTKQGILPLLSVEPSSKILVIGQAPGTKAELSQKTWNDLSGDRLREWLGVSKEQFYNTKLFGQMPMDFYYPGKAKTGDKPPRKGFAQKWHPKILKHLKNVELILLIGSYSQNYYLNDKLSLTERVKNFETYLPKYFVLSHPSPLNFMWRKQNPWFDEKVIPVLKEKIKNILKDE